MTPATRTGLHVVAAGLAVGLVADLLLPVEPWGLNVLLSTAAMVGAGAWVVRRSTVTPSKDTAWLAVSALLLGAAFLRRDAELLNVLDVFALIGIFGLGGAAAAGVSLRHAEVGRYVAAVARSAFSTLTGGVQVLFSDISWSDVPLGSRLGRFRGVALGTLLAVPLLFVFGSLFASADAAFANVLSSVLRVDLSTAAAHTFRTAVLGGLAAGYLRGIALPRGAGGTRLPSPATADVPVVTALVLLNALFLLFVAIQLRYFFGGAGRIEAVAGLTYAEYARRGFFELVWASAFVVPVLLGGDWAVRGATAAGIRRFRFAAVTTLGLMAVVMSSAFQRMRLYVAAFGLTEDRLYATAGMVFLALLLAWLGWTVLRGRSSRFAFGGTVLGLAVLAGLHTLNPDAFILRHNLTRPGAERAFDVEYAASLGADAAPGLLATLPELTPADACVAARRLVSWAAREPDWRTWNWSRARAARLGRDPLVAATLARCPAAVPDSVSRTSNP
jgi:hypothetical protein